MELFIHSFSLNTPLALTLAFLLLIQLIWVGLMNYCFQQKGLPHAFFQTTVSWSQLPPSSGDLAHFTVPAGIGFVLVHAAVWHYCSEHKGISVCSDQPLQSLNCVSLWEAKQQFLPLSSNIIHTNKHTWKVCKSLWNAYTNFRWNSLHCSKLKMSVQQDT